MNRKNLLWELWLLPGLMIGFGACQNDEIVTSAATDSEGVGTNVITLTAEIGSDVENRAIIDLANEDEDYEYVLWSEGDVLIVQNLGQDGTDTDGAIYKFEISSDYSDDSPSSSATFICTEADTDAVTEGDVLCAFYLGNDATIDDYTYYLRLNTSVEYTSYTEDEIKEYLKDYMYMVGKTTFSESGTSFTMRQLTSMLRVTYNNDTDSEQTISSMYFTGSNIWIGSYMYYDIVNEEYNIWGASSHGWVYFTEGLTVAAYESVDIYFLCFPAIKEFTNSDYIRINIEGEEVWLRTADISTATFEIGYRYWFRVTKTDTGLEWTNYELIFENYTTIDSNTNDALCEALVDKIAYSYIDDEGILQMPTDVVELTTILGLGGYELTSLDGIEYFTNLEILYCYYNDLTTLDVSALTNLKQLHCWSNNLTSLNLTNNTALTVLYCNRNQLSELDITENTNLEDLRCGNQTDSDGNDQTLTLTLSESQYDLWESTWQYNDENSNVTVSIENAE